MTTAKGTCVYCTETGREGVISSNSSGNFVYVRWLISWKLIDFGLEHYIELVSQDNLAVFLPNKVPPGLEQLRLYVIK